MKIIITYASAGSGHFKAAEAVYNYFRQNNQNDELKLIDVLQSSNFLFRNIYTYGYAFIVRHAPWLWSSVFCITTTEWLYPIIRRLNFIINRLNTKAFSEFLIQENPAFIICAHFLPSEIAAYLKRNRKINSELFTVITDFGVHPFWICKGTDIYIVASDYTKEQLVLKGITRERIKVLGIPINTKFLKRYERNILLKSFGIEQNKFTVLIVTGSFGIGPIEKIVDLLYRDVQILVVCANNKRLYQTLKNKNYPLVKIFGFINNLQELMAVSDVIITKPGGLTVSEVLAMELVPIFISAIPGQETENIKVLEKYGVGVEVKNVENIKDVIMDYRANPDKLTSVREDIKKFKKPSATQELYNVVCQGSAGNTR